MATLPKVGRRYRLLADHRGMNVSVAAGSTAACSDVSVVWAHMLLFHNRLRLQVPVAGFWDAWAEWVEEEGETG